ENHEWYLSEFRLCFDKFDFRLIDCPKKSSINGIPAPTHCPSDDKLAYPTLHSKIEKMSKMPKN
uniref:Uncharacterized protein n=1 Tax=Romanomermis culicivorax TaxID=13658 RepID=A0A915K9C1_ROMCU